MKLSVFFLQPGNGLDVSYFLLEGVVLNADVIGVAIWHEPEGYSRFKDAVALITDKTFLWFVALNNILSILDTALRLNNNVKFYRTVLYVRNAHIKSVYNLPLVQQKVHLHSLSN